MPVYSCKITGSADARLVRAKSAAQARAHLVQADTVSADELADLIEKGVKLETATAPVEEPPASGGGEADPIKDDGKTK